MDLRRLAFKLREVSDFIVQIHIQINVTVTRTTHSSCTSSSKHWAGEDFVCEGRPLAHHAGGPVAFPLKGYEWLGQPGDNYTDVVSPLGGGPVTLALKDYERLGQPGDPRQILTLCLCIYSHLVYVGIRRSTWVATLSECSSNFKAKFSNNKMHLPQPDSLWQHQICQHIVVHQTRKSSRNYPRKLLHHLQSKSACWETHTVCDRRHWFWCLSSLGEVMWTLGSLAVAWPFYKRTRDNMRNRLVLLVVSTVKLPAPSRCM